VSVALSANFDDEVLNEPWVVKVEPSPTVSRLMIWVADVEGIWFDHRLAERLREESPSAYKDIGMVMRAQQQLTRIVCKLEPVLVYKGA
jgi:hypothetical protein